jgi:hypothetical protein
MKHEGFESVGYHGDVVDFALSYYHHDYPGHKKVSNAVRLFLRLADLPQG